MKAKKITVIGIAIIVVVAIVYFVFVPTAGSFNKKADELLLQGNFEQAAILYQQAVDKDNGYAYSRLGKLYELGLGVEKDEKKAFELYKKGSNEDCVQAKINEACCYLGGLGVDKDKAKGVKMIKSIAEESNHEYAKAALASLYIYGLSGIIEKDYEKALSILKDCQEDSWALHLSGLLYYWDDGYEIDYPKAMEYFKKAYEKGGSSSAYLIGGIYRYGYGVEKNIKEAISWYEKGATRGNADATLNLGDLYQYNDSLKDMGKAMYWYKKATKLNSGDAYDRIGCLYAFGDGVEKNDTVAFQNFKKAADLKSSNGLRNLGGCYFVGRGTEKNVKKSKECWLEAVEYGSSEAAYKLYCSYSDGTFSKDEIKAEEYLAKAVKMKNPEAQKIMGDRYYNGYKVKQEAQQAFIYYKLSADAGNIDACPSVAFCYRNGYGCNKDPKKAKEYENKAQGKE